MTAYLITLVLSGLSGVRLDYTRGEGAEACPDEQALRGALAVRLGYDAFRGDGRRKVNATVTRTGNALVGRVTLEGPSGITGEREVRSNSSDCAELAEAMVLAICLAIDPLGTGAKPVPPPPAPAPPPRPEAPKVVAAPPAPPPGPELSAGLSAHVFHGLEPTFSAGGTLQVRLKWTRLSLGVEGRVTAPMPAALPEGRMVSSSLGGAVTPCLHGGPFFGCALLAGGALWLSTEGVDGGQRVTGNYLAAGARGGVELRVLEWLLLRAHVDAALPIVRTTVALGDQVVFTSPLIALGGGLGAVFVLWSDR